MTTSRKTPIRRKPRSAHREETARAACADPGAGPRRSKLDQIVEHLARPEGASLADLVALTGWQPHSVRGALAGSLKKKGVAVIAEKIDGERRYRLGAPA